MKLGIRPERIKPGHPAKWTSWAHASNVEGRDGEPPAANRRAQQKAFDRFRQQFNEERPHEALEQKTPASCYHCCRAPIRIDFLNRNTAPTWPKRVYPDGTFFWKGTQIFISKCLGGEFIGMEQTDDRYWDVHFATFPLRASIVISSSCTRCRTRSSEWLWK